MKDQLKIKKIVRKDKIAEEIDSINRIMDSLKETNKTLDYVNDTIMITNGEIIDRKSFSIMSLPSTKRLLRDF